MTSLLYIVGGLVAAYLIGVLAALLTRGLQLLGAKLNQTHLGQRLAIDDLIVDAAIRAVSEVEATLVKTAKAASATGKLSKADAVEALERAKDQLRGRVLELGAAGVYTEQDLNALVEYALRTMNLTGEKQ